MTDQASDAVLLERFASDRDQGAFLELVQRHGSMVLKVCRRVLSSEHDVEDVFQATFLTLANKARVVDWEGSVGAWLHAVARRLALHARTRATQRERRERPLAALAGTGADGRSGRLAEEHHPRSSVMEEIERRDLRGLLDDALGQLPEKYRAPVVLCYLEGKTNEEAARQLGWPAGSISRRLDRARSLLKRRLAGSGWIIVVGSGLCGAHDSQDRASGFARPIRDGARAASDEVVSALGRGERGSPGDP